jgi:hypothetical protein
LEKHEIPPGPRVEQLRRIDAYLPDSKANTHVKKNFSNPANFLPPPASIPATPEATSGTTQPSGCIDLPL